MKLYLFVKYFDIASQSAIVILQTNDIYFCIKVVPRYVFVPATNFSFYPFMSVLFVNKCFDVFFLIFF